jgi:uncharacterized protein (TIGR02996 family)
VKADHERAFLDDIIAHPDDDAPRLVFADWLDDHDESERAELIRVQCALARCSPFDRGLPDLEAREQVLLSAHGEHWAAPLRGFIDEWKFRRGFLECVAIKQASRATFCYGIDALFADFPIRAVRFECEPSPALFLLRKPAYFARLSSLDAKDLHDADPKELVDLLLQGEAAGLRSLLLECRESSHDWDAQLRRLAEPGPLAGLTELGLAFGTVGSPPNGSVIAALATSPALTRLARLHIPFSELGLPVARHLATSATLEHLTHLDLGCAEISEGGWRRLAGSRTIARLHWLGLFGARVVKPSGEQDDLEEHPLGQQFRALLGNYADFETSDTFIQRWAGQRWSGPKEGDPSCN